MKVHPNIATGFFCLVLSLTSILLISCATAPLEQVSPVPESGVTGNYRDLRRDISRSIKKQLKKHNITGLSIALVDERRIVWTQGFGYADKSGSIPATADTVYRVGSITKLFTATAVMQMAEKELIDIDQPLRKYLPQFEIKSRFSNSAPVTPRTILSHHSGLPSDYINGMWGDDSVHFTDLVTLLQEEYVATPPNTFYSYSNVGYSLLGHMIENVSGQSYADRIDQTILQPLGMENSYIAENLDAGPLMSKGYIDGKAYPTPSLRDQPAGSLNSSVRDLARFAGVMLADGRINNRQILQTDTLRNMLSHQDGAAPFDLSPMMGLGWVLSDSLGDDAGQVAWHDGGTLMFHSQLVTLPKHKLAVVVLANSSSGGHAVAALARQTLTQALKIKTGIEVNRQTDTPIQLHPSTPKDVQEISGSYSTEFGLVKIFQKKSDLKLETGNETLDLRRETDHCYHLRNVFLGFIPISLGGLEKTGYCVEKTAGRKLLVAQANGRRRIFGEAIKPQILPASWNKRLGHYEIVNPAGSISRGTLELRIEENNLVMQFNLQGSPFFNDEAETLALTVITDTESVVHGLGRNRGDTVRVVMRNNAELLSYSGFLLKLTTKNNQLFHPQR